MRGAESQRGGREEGEIKILHINRYKDSVFGQHSLTSTVLLLFEKFTFALKIS